MLKGKRNPRLLHLDGLLNDLARQVLKFGHEGVSAANFTFSENRSLLTGKDIAHQIITMFRFDATPQM